MSVYGAKQKGFELHLHNLLGPHSLCTTMVRLLLLACMPRTSLQNLRHEEITPIYFSYYTGLTVVVSCFCLFSLSQRRCEHVEHVSLRRGAAPPRGSAWDRDGRVRGSAPLHLDKVTLNHETSGGTNDTCGYAQSHWGSYPNPLIHHWKSLDLSFVSSDW